MATIIRRIRSVVKPKNTAVLAEKLKLIAKQMAIASAASAEIKKHEAEILALMGSDKLLSFEIPGVTANITRSSGKATNTVDPKGLRARLKSDEEYYSCISVSITKVKEFLGAKELDKLTTTAPGKVGEPSLKIVVAK